jgi:alpha-tubulin suppressor-like RCC1 family protein
MALTRSGKAFSWGYKGKGLLGRQDDGFNGVALPVGQGLSFNQIFKVGRSNFVEKYIQNQ